MLGTPAMRAAWLPVLVLAGCPTADDPSLTHPCDPAVESCPVSPSCDRLQPVGPFELCTQIGDASYTVVIKYVGPGQLALDRSDVRLDGRSFDASSAFDSDTQT